MSITYWIEVDCIEVLYRAADGNMYFFKLPIDFDLSTLTQTN